VAKSATADFREQRVSKRRKREARCHIPGRAQSGPGSRANDRALRPLPWLPDAASRLRECGPGRSEAIQGETLGRPTFCAWIASSLTLLARTAHPGFTHVLRVRLGDERFSRRPHPRTRAARSGVQEPMRLPLGPGWPFGPPGMWLPITIQLTQTSEAQRHIPGRRRRPGVQGKRHDLMRSPLGPECRFAAPGMWCSSVTPRAKSKHRPSPMRA